MLHVPTGTTSNSHRKHTGRPTACTLLYGHALCLSANVCFRTWKAVLLRGVGFAAGREGKSLHKRAGETRALQSIRMREGRGGGRTPGTASEHARERPASETGQELRARRRAKSTDHTLNGTSVNAERVGRLPFGSTVCTRYLYGIETRRNSEKCMASLVVVEATLFTLLAQSTFRNKLVQQWSLLDDLARNLTRRDSRVPPTLCNV